MTSEDNDRLLWVDIAKGIAILSVIYEHTICGSLLAEICRSFHIPLFFVLAGYFIRQGNFWQRTKKDVKTLLGPYTITVILGFVCNLFFSGDWKSAEQWRYLSVLYAKSWFFGMSFSSTILTDVLSVMMVWFVVCLFFAKLMFNGINNYFVSERVKAGIVLVLAVTGWFIGTKVAFLPYSFDVAMVAVFFLYAGNCLSLAGWSPQKEDFRKGRFYLLLIVLLAIWLFYFRTGNIIMPLRMYPMFPMCVIGAFCGCMIMSYTAKFCEQNILLTKILAFFGKNSLIVLIVHSLELFYIQGLLHDGGPYTGLSAYELLCVRLVLIVIVVNLWLLGKWWVRGERESEKM